MKTDTQLPYYDSIRGELSGSQMSKARKFVELDKIAKLSRDRWFVSFIPGYNTSMYLVTCCLGDYFCNCQYNRTKHKTCSHIMAVMLYEGGRAVQAFAGAYVRVVARLPGGKAGVY